MQKKLLFRNIGVVTTTLFFIGASLIPASAFENQEKLIQRTGRGDILYVGGSGPGNYTTIQDAINDSHDGDTVFVYSGVYDERLVIPTAIRLIGESKNSTTIEFNTSEVEELILLDSDNITLSGFTLRCTGNSYFSQTIISNFFGPSGNITISDNVFRGNNAVCIDLTFLKNCTFTKNIFLDYNDGIFLWMAENCTIANNMFNTTAFGSGINAQDVSFCSISNNSFLSNYFCIRLYTSEFTTISNNYFFNNKQDIEVETSSNISILSNRIEKPKYDLYFISVHITLCFGTLVEKNLISHAKLGVFLEKSDHTVVSMNTFMENIVNARFFGTLYFSHNTWSQNYWGRSRVLPKPIFGIKNIYSVFPGFVEFDWHPAQKPYNSSDGGLQA